MVAGKTIVLIPTYQERENISHLLRSLLTFDVHILVVDDNSPDKTWKVVRDLAKKDRRVHLLLRKKLKGRGYAGRDGFKWCLDHGAKYIIEMDADFSHHPRYISKIIQNLKECDVVLGSRFIAGGKQSGRSLMRRCITKLANFYIRVMFGIKIKDCNSGYRGFKREVIKRIAGQLTSSGPDIVQEVLFLVHKYKFKIKEIPIKFKERKVGNSKLRMKEIIRGYIRVLIIKIRG